MPQDSNLHHFIQLNDSYLPVGRPTTGRVAPLHHTVIFFLWVAGGIRTHDFLIHSEAL